MDYVYHLLDAVDFVAAGRKGFVSEDKYLINNYQPDFYSAVQSHLKSSNQNVRIEIINLLKTVNERAAIDDIKKLRASDNELVVNACIGYLSTMKESDDLIPTLFDILEHKNGPEFIRAAVKMRKVGRPQDISRLRKTYGQVRGEQRIEMHQTLECIIERFPELQSKKDFILSVPIFPDQNKFEKFLDKGIVYLDIRYRDSIESADRITMKTYNNIAFALNDMQIRLYNERDNLQYYDKEIREQFKTLEELVIWAAEDLSSKEVIKDETTVGRVKGLDNL